MRKSIAPALQIYLVYFIEILLDHRIRHNSHYGRSNILMRTVAVPARASRYGNYLDLYHAALGLARRPPHNSFRRSVRRGVVLVVVRQLGKTPVYNAVVPAKVGILQGIARCQLDLMVEQRTFTEQTGRNIRGVGRNIHRLVQVNLDLQTVRSQETWEDTKPSGVVSIP